MAWVGCCSYNDGMSEDLLFTAETEMAEVARPLWAGQLAVMEQHRAALLAEAGVTAVHETRKAIRRTFTGVKLFRPFFEPGTLESYRRQFKKMMRRLGQARDTAVFRQSLQAYTEESGQSLACLAAYWQEQQAVVDEAVRNYVRKPKWAMFFEEYGRFTHTPGLYALLKSEPSAPMTAAYHIPLLIEQRVAAVQAYAQQLDGAPLERLHALRIQGKELRYTLQFFAPLLGPELELVLVSLKQMQEHLGVLQDAHTAMRFLAGMEECETAVATYRAVKEQEITQLVTVFPEIWDEMNSTEWQQNLAAAISVL